MAKRAVCFRETRQIQQQKKSIINTGRRRSETSWQRSQLMTASLNMVPHALQHVCVGNGGRQIKKETRVTTGQLVWSDLN